MARTTTTTTTTKDLLTVIFGFLLIIATIAGTIIPIYRSSRAVKKIEKDGVYVIGKITSSTKGSQGKTDFNFTYVYKGDAFETSLRSLASQHSLDDQMFLRISASDPSTSIFLAGYPQPCECYNFETAPAEGWKEIPICREMEINKYSFLFPFVTGDKYTY